MRLGGGEAGKTRLGRASHEQLRSLRSHPKECEAGGVMRLNFFSNFYGKTEIIDLFILIFKIIIY